MPWVGNEPCIVSKKLSVYPHNTNAPADYNRSIDIATLYHSTWTDQSNVFTMASCITSYDGLWEQCVNSSVVQA